MTLAHSIIMAFKSWRKVLGKYQSIRFFTLLLAVILLFNQSLLAHITLIYPLSISEFRLSFAAIWMACISIALFYCACIIVLTEKWGTLLFWILTAGSYFSVQVHQGWQSDHPFYFWAKDDGVSRWPELIYLACQAIAWLFLFAVYNKIIPCSNVWFELRKALLFSRMILLIIVMSVLVDFKDMQRVFSEHPELRSEVFPNYTLSNQSKVPEITQPFLEISRYE